MVESTAKTKSKSGEGTRVWGGRERVWEDIRQAAPTRNKEQQRWSKATV